jgi:hypothetical protein
LAVGLTLGLSFASTGAVAALANVPFSAEMVKHGPDGATTTGRMYVGTDRMRVEMSQQGRTMVRIVDDARRTEWILFPEERRYIEHATSPTMDDAPMAGADAESPCADMPGLVCRKLGQETIAGRSATKWEIGGSHQGRDFTTTQWIDDERGIPLLQELPNGQTIRLAPVGRETLDGREVEKWEMVASGPNRPESRTFQWYDPELELVIRQEFPGGIVNELRNIVVGEQREELFVVPSDYTRMTPPPGAMGGPSSGGPMR